MAANPTRPRSDASKGPSSISGSNESPRRYYFGTRTRRTRTNAATSRERKCQLTDADGLGEHDRHTYDIFEGTEQIQQLVISRAISGMRIE